MRIPLFAAIAFFGLGALMSASMSGEVYCDASGRYHYSDDCKMLAENPHGVGKLSEIEARRRDMKPCGLE
jgi:hypothetical protein